MQLKYFFLLFLLPGLVFGPISRPLHAAEAESRVQKAAPSGLKADWDNLIVAAKKEGKVVIYCDTLIGDAR